jgi:bacterioferritin-associated ferredoxin
MAQVAAISAAGVSRRLDKFQMPGICGVNLESLQNAAFSFASRCPSQYRLDRNGRFPVQMIVCSCNVLSDHDVRHAVNSADDLPRNAKQIYGCLGCSAECGRCARTIKDIIDDALGACARACQAGCPHSHRPTPVDTPAGREFALAAS